MRETDFFPGLLAFLIKESLLQLLGFVVFGELGQNRLLMDGVYYFHLCNQVRCEMRAPFEEFISSLHAVLKTQRTSFIYTSTAQVYKISIHVNVPYSLYRVAFLFSLFFSGLLFIYLFFKLYHLKKIQSAFTFAQMDKACVYFLRKKKTQHKL